MEQFNFNTYDGKEKKQKKIYFKLISNPGKEEIRLSEVDEEGHENCGSEILVIYAGGIVLINGYSGSLPTICGKVRTL